MSYNLENKDIVLSGMQDGIADSPYEGIADMRNVNILTVKGEGSVQYKEVSVVLPPVLNAVAFSASASTDRLTWAGPNTLYESAALYLAFPNSAEYLVVAGGGGGGGGEVGGNGGGGGGGAGGMKTGTLSLAPGAYTITVGAAGSGGGQGTAPTFHDGTAGSNSSIAALVVSTGGGLGAAYGRNGGNGGSGGGGGGEGGSGSTTGGTGAAAQGNAGGGAGPGVGAGGGGGSSTAGTTATANPGGAGGTGTSSSITGSAVTYAAGGSGGGFNSGNGTAGTTNRGNGGGGGGTPTTGNGADGGSGIVVIRYLVGTLDATGGTITTSGGYTIHSFTTSGTFTVNGGVTPGIVYYARNIVGTTFQLSLAPGSTDIVNITGDFTGTFTSYQYGNQRGLPATITSPCPVSYIVDRNRTNGLSNGIYLTDLSNYLWGIFPVAMTVNGLVSFTIPANSLVFMGNIGGVGADASAATGINIWEGYFFLFGPDNDLDVGNIDDIWSDGPDATTWTYTWWNATIARKINLKVPTLVGQDNTVYYCSDHGVGSILVNAGEIFDPTDSTTYTRNAAALSLPSFDNSTCLAELGVNLLVGGENSFVYPWDRVSTSFSYPIVVPDNYIANIIGTNQNAYIFAGNRGRIYITNGSSIDEYKKIPDYLTGIINPYYRWRDASFARNQLYFSFTVSTNADVAVETMNGAWAVNLTNDALYMANKITNSGYSGMATMVVEMPAASLSDQPSGTSLTIGWNVGGAYGIDVGSSNPYTSLESFIEFDMIPIGTFLKPFSPAQIEWKTSTTLGGNGTAETIRLLYRKNLTDSFTQIGSSTFSTAPTENAQNVSAVFPANFQKTQWIQIRAEMSSTATTPTFCRLTEVRIREWPSS